MKKTISIWLLRFAAMIMFLAVQTALSQSVDQNFPTPVTASELHGSIRARDIGDSRVTTYFYAFDGEQGDIFVNVLTRNFNGDIDIFTVEGVRPLTKIVIYADSGANETGRIVYLRKPERLLLRIEGRSPDDNPATFVIKFAGSFVALKPTKRSDDPVPLPSFSDASGGIRLNSAGAVVPEAPKPKPDLAAVIRHDPKLAPAQAKSGENETAKPAAAQIDKEPEPLNPSNTAADKEPGLVILDGTPKTEKEPESEKATEPSLPANDAATKKPARRPLRRRPTRAQLKKPPVVKPVAEGDSETRTAPKVETNPLANVRLVILLKDGNTFERPMSEVVRFSAERGMLTVIARDGTIVRYPLINVAKVSMQ